MGLVRRTFSNLLASSASVPLGWSLILAFALRVVWAIIVPTVPISDGSAYDILANNLADHGVYGWASDQPSAYWPVGTSAIYAAFYRLFGHAYGPVVAFNILCSLGIIWISWRLGARFFGKPVANLTAMILAVWPSLIFYVTILASELPFMLLTLAALDVWSEPTFTGVRRGLLAGILIAGATYIRPIALLLPLVFFISELFRKRNLKEQILSTGTALLVMAMLIAPWTYRNFQLLGAPILISTNGPVTFWMGNHPATDGGYAPIPSDAVDLGEVERANLLGQRARDFVLGNPAEFIRLTLYKLIRLHSYETIAVTWNADGIARAIGPGAIMPLKIVTQGFWWLVLAAGLAGVALLVANGGIAALFTSPPLFVWAYFAAVHSVIVAQDRYHFPFIPIVALFAASSLVHLLAMRRRDTAG